MSNGPDWPIAFCPIPFSKDAKSVHLWEGVFLYCWGKTLLHTKPSPSPSLSIFPSSLLAAVFLSELGSGAKLFFFPFFFVPPSSSRHNQELADLLTPRNACFLFLHLPCPTLIYLLCTDLILDYRLRSKYSHPATWRLWGFTLLCEKSIQRNAFMVRCLTGRFCLLTSCCPPFILWHHLGFPIYLLERLLLSISHADSKVFFCPPFWLCATAFSGCLCQEKILKSSKWKENWILLRQRL